MMSLKGKSLRKSDKLDKDYQHVPDFYVSQAIRRIQSAGSIRPTLDRGAQMIRPHTAIVRLSEVTNQQSIQYFDQNKMNEKSFDRAAKRSDRSLRILKTRTKSAQSRSSTTSAKADSNDNSCRACQRLSVTGVSVSDLVAFAGAPDDKSPPHHATPGHNSVRSSDYGWAIDRLSVANPGANSGEWGAKKIETGDKKPNYSLVQFQRPRGFVGSTRYVDIQKRRSMAPSERAASVAKKENDNCKVNNKFQDLEFSRSAKGSLIRLGRGAFGSVYQGRCYGAVVAIKATSKHIAKRESEALKAIRSVHIIKMLKTIHIGTWWCIVLEKAETSLEAVVQKRCGLELESVQYITACMILALHEVHKAGWVHLDVKLTNILLNKHGKPKLCDFSSARHWQAGEEFSSDDSYPVGSEGYWAPEIVRREPFNNMADWFSLGVTMYKMLCGQLPWIMNDLDMLYKLEEGVIEYDDTIFSHDAVHFIQSLLRDDPRQRLGHSHADIRAHRWFQGILWSNLEKSKIRAPVELQECVEAMKHV